jgi:RimJ/RimL family protein N-acetyltransferase
VVDSEPVVPRYADGVVQLDAYRLSDIPAHLAGEDEETARRFGWWPQRSTAETAERAFSDWAEQWRNNGPRKTFAVRQVSSGALVGGCELRRQQPGHGHVSYWIGASHRRQGFATRALVLLREHALVEGIAVLQSHVAADNHASRAVSEHAGFIASSTYRDEHGTDVVCYEWRLSGTPPVPANPASESADQTP